MTRTSWGPGIAAAALGAALATTGQAQTVAPSFASNYTAASLGSVAGVPTAYGGLTFLNANTLLIGGAANQAGGAIYQVGVSRDASSRITGFSGPASPFASAPYIDGGLSFGPDDVLFYTGFPIHAVGQIEPGNAAPSRVDDVSAILPGSVGGLGFIPAGFANAGQLALLSYNANVFRRAIVSPDGSGTYALTAAPGAGPVTLTGGLEGIAWVPTGSPLFAAPSVLISEYGNGVVSTYTLDANGDPIPASRQAFVTGLSGAEGAVIDPVTGDFLFSTFGGSNQVVRVSGFAAPPGTVTPEPVSMALLATGLIGIGLLRRRRRRTSDHDLS